MHTTIRERLDMLREERQHHVTSNAYPEVDEWSEYISTDGEAAFKHEDDVRYYERLTGHIEELEYLMTFSATA